MATRWQEGVCWLWKEGGTLPVEDNTAAMPCWAQWRHESRSTASTSSNCTDPSDIAITGLQPLPSAYSGSTHTHTMDLESQHTHTPVNSRLATTSTFSSIWHQPWSVLTKMGKTITPFSFFVMGTITSSLPVKNKMDASLRRRHTSRLQIYRLAQEALIDHGTHLFLSSSGGRGQHRKTEKSMGAMLQRMLIQRRDFFL